MLTPAGQAVQAAIEPARELVQSILPVSVPAMWAFDPRQEITGRSAATDGRHCYPGDRGCGCCTGAGGRYDPAPGRRSVARGIVRCSLTPGASLRPSPSSQSTSRLPRTPAPSRAQAWTADAESASRGPARGVFSVACQCDSGPTQIGGGPAGRSPDSNRGGAGDTGCTAGRSAQRQHVRARGRRGGRGYGGARQVTAQPPPSDTPATPPEPTVAPEPPLAFWRPWCHSCRRHCPLRLRLRRGAPTDVPVTTASPVVPPTHVPTSCRPSSPRRPRPRPEQDPGAPDRDCTADADERADKDPTQTPVPTATPKPTRSRRSSRPPFRPTPRQPRRP